MNNYQFGKQLNIKEVMKNKEYYAKVFSEGSIELEALLLKLWNNNIETFMCCTGHEMDDAAYIMMYLPTTNKELMYTIINSVYNEDQTYITVGKEHDREEILIDIKSYCGGNFFKKINVSLDNPITNNKVENNIYNMIGILSEFNYKTFDLYYEIFNIRNQKRLDIYANYCKDNGDGLTRHLHVLRKTTNLNDEELKKDAFSKDEFESKIDDINERGRQKTIFKR
ncbi:MAG: hypothetical protein PHG18_01700 [Bacilli bacterium]|nr:hypothetical protein [Bacilli bacterium]